MPSTRTAERAVLVTLALIVVWDTWQLHHDSRTLDELTEKVAITEAKIKGLSEQRTKMPMSSLSPDLLRPRGSDDGQGSSAGVDRASDPIASASADDGATAPRARARRHGDVPNVPGAQVLSRLYDAADQMAADENWSNETYEQVATVFEGTITQMKGLVADVKSGRVTPAQAKAQAVQLRDGATGQLSNVLGKDGLQRLKGYIKEDGPQ